MTENISPTPTDQPTPRWLSILLAALLTVYGIIAAVAAYQSAQAGGKEAEMNAVGLLDIARSIDAYSLADQTVNQDSTAITQLLLADVSGATDEVYDIWFNTLSEDAITAFERSEDLDDAYFDSLYADADALNNNAFAAYDAAGEWGNVGDAYDLVLLVVAFGLALAGWGAVSEHDIIAPAFAAISTLVLVFVIYLLVTALLIPTPPVITPF